MTASLRAGVFGAIVSRTRERGGHIAVYDGSGAASYAEILERALALSSHLGRLGLRPQDRVGVWLENSRDYLVVLLACLAGDFVFVPLAVSDPEARIGKIANDAALAACVTRPERTESPALETVPVCISTSQLTSLPAGALRTEWAAGGEIVYCIYTSGTTGAPKGVLIRGESIANFVQSTVDIFGLSRDTNALCVSPFHFDGAFGSLFSVLCVGGTLVIPPPGPLLPAKFVSIVAERQITHTSFSPSFLRVLVSGRHVAQLRHSSLRTIGLGGEDLSRDDLVAFLSAAPDVRVFNRYGPTETTVVASTFEITEDALSRSEKIPIGQPGPGVTFHLVEGSRLISENDVAGELCIGGIQVMAGYNGDPATTDAVLRTDIVPGRMLYRTGDLVDRNARGEYVFRGRLDSVVKRDGNRISLVEISDALRSAPGIDDVACTADSKMKGRTTITAYVAGREVEPGQLRGHLLQRLPAYMLPDKFVFLEHLPRLTSGKLDMNRLKSIGSEAMT